MATGANCFISRNDLEFVKSNLDSNGSKIMKKHFQVVAATPASSQIPDDSVMFARPVEEARRQSVEGAKPTRKNFIRANIDVINKKVEMQSQFAKSVGRGKDA